MTLDEYRDAWNAQDTGEELPGDEELVAVVQRQADAFDRTIRRRDRLETLVGVVVALFFGFEAVTATTWLERAGAATVILAAAFIAWWLRRARTSDAPGAGLPVADRIRAERDKVDAQIRLLESVLWWYLAPLGLGITLFILGQGAGATVTVGSLTVVVIVCGIIWRLNQRAVRCELRPRRERLSRLLAQLREA